MARTMTLRPDDEVSKWESLTSENSAWERSERNPVFPTVPGTWMEAQTANPDLLLIGDTYFMYFRGQQGGHDRIGLATCPRNRFDGVSWSILPEPVSARASSPP